MKVGESGQRFVEPSLEELQHCPARTRGPRSSFNVQLSRYPCYFFRAEPNRLLARPVRQLWNPADKLGRLYRQFQQRENRSNGGRK